MSDDTVTALVYGVSHAADGGQGHDILTSHGRFRTAPGVFAGELVPYSGWVELTLDEARLVASWRKVERSAE